MADDIKQRIVLEGEKEYSAAIREAQRNLKTLRSELKAETAELGANATAQQKNETKVKSLQKQIKEQEKIVKTYQAALKEVKEKYGDNEDAVAKWEQKLNDARATLANMRNSVDSAGGSIKTFSQDAQQGTSATNSFSDSLKSVSEVAGSVSTAIEGLFTSVISTITSAIGSLWGELMTIAAKSDNYLDLASFLGSTATDVQKWDHAMKSVGGDISTVTNLISRLRYGGKADKVTEWFGISAENYTDDLEYFEVVMRKMVEMKDEMVANGTWDNAMSDIFGAKKVQDVSGILSDWEDILTGLAEFDVENGGAGMSQEEIETMGEMYNKALLLQETWQAFKESFLAGAFGKIGLTLVGDAQNILDALIKYVETGDETALAELEAGIEQFFTDLGTAIETAAQALDEVGGKLADSENGYVALLGRVLQGLSDVLEWLTDPNSLTQIESFFTTLIDLWISAKFVQAVGNIASLATNLTTLLNFKGGSGLLSGASDTTTSTTGGNGTRFGFLGGKGMGIEGVEGFGGIGLAAGFVLGEAQRFHDAWKDAEKYLDPNKEVDDEFLDAWTQSMANQGLIPADQVEEIAQKNKDMLHAIQEIQDEDLYKSTIENNHNGVGYVDVVSDEIIHKDRRGGKSDVEISLDNLTEGITNLSRKLAEGGASTLLTDSEWWKNKQGGLTSSDIAAFQSVPAMMSEAVASGVSGIRVTLDGYAVGSLVAPYVSQMIARDYP